MHSRFQSSPKIFKSYKCDSPGGTVQRIVRGFARYRLKPSYTEHRASVAGFSLYSGSAALNGIGLACNGKGETRLLSMASAYAELAERFSGHERYNVGGEAIARLCGISEPYALLKGYAEIMPDSEARRICRMLIGTYVQLNKKLTSRMIRQPYFEHWVDADNILNGKVLKLPGRLIQFVSGSNGLAAGNTIEEAAAEAISEVLERRAYADFVIGKRPAPTIAHNSIENRQLRRMLGCFRDIGYRVVIKDLSRGSNVPIVGMVVVNDRLRRDSNPYIRRHHRQLRVGCHANREQALMRCLTEEFQGHTVHHYARAQFRRLDAFWKEWMQEGVLEVPKAGDGDVHAVSYKQMRFLGSTDHFEQAAITQSFSDVPTHPSEDALEDLTNLAMGVAKLGHEVYFIDHTDEKLDFPVVRIVSPGLSDLIPYYPIQWIDDNGFVPRLLEWNHNLAPYYSSDEWLKFEDGIRQVLHILEDYFKKYGVDVSIKAGPEKVWLFYLAFKLRLLLKDEDAAYRYIRTIKAIGEDRGLDDPTLGPVFYSYLKMRAEGKSMDLALRKIELRSGKLERKAVERILKDHDLKRVEFVNPFRQN